MLGHRSSGKNESLRKALRAAGVFVALPAVAWLVLQPATGWLAIAGMVVAVILIGLGSRPLSLHVPACGIIAMLILVLMSVVSLLVTPVPAVTWTRAWFLWGNIALLCLLILWAQSRARLASLAVALTALGVVFALAAPFVVRWAAQRTPLLFPVSIYAKFPSLGAETIHPNNMASILVGLMFVPLGWAARPPLAQESLGRIHGLLRNRWLWAIAVLLMAGALVLTQSRGGYMAAGAGIVVFLLFMSRRRRFLWPLVAVVMAVGVVVALHERSLWVAALAPEALDTQSLAFRWRVWRYALFLVGDFPFTGVGMGAFNDAALALYGFDGFRQPGAHSLFLQVALDVGLPGLIALLVMVGAVLAGAVRAFATFRRLDDALLWPLASGAIAGLSAILTHGLIDIAAWGTRGSFVLWCLLGLLAGLGIFARDLAEGTSPVNPVAAP